MSDWQPIETVPKDGSWIIICRRGEQDSCEVGCYDPLLLDHYEPVEGGLFKKVRELVHDWQGINNFHRATHWMPVQKVPGA